MVDDAESLGLHALFLMIHSRRTARLAGPGEPVLLPDQNRRLWSGPLVAEGQRQLDRALRLERPGPYQIEAAIQALHNEAPTAADTDWAQIVALYRRLADWRPTPVVALNHAVAVGEAEGPMAALSLLDHPSIGDPLQEYAHYHSSRAEFLRRLGRSTEAAAAYQRALDLIEHDLERRFLERRLAEVSR